MDVADCQLMRKGGYGGRRYGREKAPFGKIPHVRGENEKLQIHIAKQKAHAVQKFHFRES